jgi:cytoskeletal protein CcmA (bactofilin family)
VGGGTCAANGVGAAIISWTLLGASMFTRSSSAEPQALESRMTRRPNAVQPTIGTPSTGEKSVIGNDLKIIGQGLKIIGRGILQVDGEIEGDVHAAEVIVGEKGQVSGMVAGRQVVVRGTVSGVICAQTVALQASSHVDGDGEADLVAVVEHSATPQSATAE